MRLSYVENYNAERITESNTIENTNNWAEADLPPCYNLNARRDRPYLSPMYGGWSRPREDLTAALSETISSHTAAEHTNKHNSRQTFSVKPV